MSVMLQIILLTVYVYECVNYKLLVFVQRFVYLKVALYHIICFWT